LSLPSRLAAAISALTPPRAAADVAVAQLTGPAGVEVTGEGDDAPVAAGELLAGGVLAGDDEHAATTNARTAAPAQR
jgi:hypothetical protein